MSQWKDRKRGDWRYHFQHRGKAYAGGGFKTRREAAAGEAKRREELKKIPKPRTGTDFLTASNACLDDAERRYVHSTYSCKRLVYRTFLEKVGNVEMADVTARQISQHLMTLSTNCRFNVHRKELSNLWQYAIKVIGLPLTNPLLSIEKLPHTRQHKSIPTEEEIIKIILAARPGDEKDLILCILHTLGRIDEILRLKWTDVNFDRKIVTLYTRKRKGGSYEADDLPMSQDLTDLMTRRWRARKQDVWVFWNEVYKNRYIHMQKTMPRICKRAEIAPIGKGSRKINGEKVEVDLYYGFHSLRHFMASYHHDTLKTGTSAVSKLLRHKSFRTTEVYLHSIDESVRAAVARQDGIFTPENANPQAQPASISEKANDFS